MFWLNNYTELLKPILIPESHMTMDEKLNTIMRFIIFYGILIALLFNNNKIILFIIIILIISIYIYNYHVKIKYKNEEFLNKENLDIIDNNICIKPTIDNPFMNRNILDNKFKDYNSCPINNKINNNIYKLFNNNIYIPSDDLYETKNMNRTFYSMPSNKIPNDQEKYINSLYKRKKTCKENNGLQCYNNLYNDLRKPN